MSEPAWIGNPQDVADAKTRHFDRVLPIAYDSGTDTVNVEAANLNVNGSPVGGGGGGSAAQVFEVTDLLIPAGTDWSENLHILGSFPLTNADLIIPNIYIEVAAPLTGSDLLGIGLVDAQVASGGNWWGPGTAVESDVPGVWAYNADTQRLSGIVPGTPDLTSVPTPVTAYVYLSTGGPTTADITVVRARAAFLVI